MENKFFFHSNFKNDAWRVSSRMDGSYFSTKRDEWTHARYGKRVMKVCFDLGAVFYPLSSSLTDDVW